MSRKSKRGRRDITGVLLAVQRAGGQQPACLTFSFDIR